MRLSRLGLQATLGLIFILSSQRLDGAEIVGQVVDARTQQHLAGVLIRAIPLVRHQREIRAISENDGRYQIDLLRGEYRFFVSLPNSDYLPQFYSSRGDQQGDIIDIAAFESFRIINLSLVPGGSISGLVLRATDSTPLPRVRIEATSPTFRASILSTIDGTYRLRALPRGRYRVRAQALDTNFVAVYYGGSRDPEKAVIIPVEDSQTSPGVDFRLHNGGMISGRVYANRNREPLSGAIVIAENETLREPIYSTTTDDQGFYTLRGLSSGSYTIQTSLGVGAKSGRAGKKFLTQYHGGSFDRESSERISVEAGTVFSGTDFALLEGASISGTVRSRFHNEPLPDVTLLSQNIEGSGLTTFQAPSNADGRFTISNLPPGKYWVETSLPSHVKRLVNFFYRNKLNTESADKISLDEGEDMQQIDFNLVLGGTIRGEFRVEDDAYELRPGGKSLNIKKEESDPEGFGTRKFKLKNDGSFLVERTPPGRYSLSPVLDDPNLLLRKSSQEKTVELSEGELIEGVEFPLRVVGSITGTISFANQPFDLDRLALFVVSLRDNSESYFELLSEKYTIPGLEPGRYFVALLTKPEANPVTFGLPPGRIYDTRLVDVKRGETTTGADLRIASESDSTSSAYP